MSELANLQVSQPASENYTKLIIDSLCENEKAYRSIQMNLKIETMRKDLLLAQLEQSKIFFNFYSQI